MSFKFRRIGEDKLLMSVRQVPHSIKVGLRRGAYIAGKTLTKYTRDQMTHGAKTGRLYKIYRGIGGRRLANVRLHRASGPGEYPAVVTGALRKSVDFKVRGHRVLEFGANTEYAKALEVGSRKLAPRRYLKQTVVKLKSRVSTDISREINKSLKQKGFDVKKV
jgi:hypothetical protein